MTYRLPSLNGLLAFEAAARHLSMKHAANELCVTAGAVSQQVKSLEDSLGVLLFERTSRGIALTSEGEAYLESVSEAFDLLSSATDKVSTSLKGRKFRVGIASYLDKELMQRLGITAKPSQEGFIAEPIEEADLNLIFKGELDAILRPRVKTHPGLHLDQIEYTTQGGDINHVTLALMPGNKGCRAHRLLLEALTANLKTK